MLKTIIQNDLQHLELAFLSACQTRASSGDEKLSEEAVHLAAGVSTAGYRGVVATMWSISDRYAPEIAQGFYQTMIGLGLGSVPGMVQGCGAAEALHRVV